MWKSNYSKAGVGDQAEGECRLHASPFGGKTEPRSGHQDQERQNCQTEPAGHREEVPEGSKDDAPPSAEHGEDIGALPRTHARRWGSVRKTTSYRK